MSTLVTETVEYDEATALPTRGQDGEVIYMDAGAAPQWPLWQRLYNRTALLRRAVYGALVWSGRVDIDGAANTGAVGITVGMIETVVVKDGNSMKGFTKAETALNIGAQVLSADTWYNVFVYVSGVALVYEVTTTATNASGVWKSGAADTHRFLFGFRAGAGGVPLSGTLRNGRFLYRLGDALAATFNLNVGTGADTSFTTVACAGLVPPHARVAILAVKAVGGGAPGVAGAVEVQTNGDASTGAHTVFTPMTSLAAASCVYEVPTDSSQQVQYRVVGGAGAPVAAIDCLGWAS